MSRKSAAAWQKNIHLQVERRILRSQGATVVDDGTRWRVHPCCCLRHLLNSFCRGVGHWELCAAFRILSLACATKTTQPILESYSYVFLTFSVGVSRQLEYCKECHKGVLRHMIVTQTHSSEGSAAAMVAVSAQPYEAGKSHFCRILFRRESRHETNAPDNGCALLSYTAACVLLFISRGRRRGGHVLRPDHLSADSTPSLLPLARPPSA